MRLAEQDIKTTEVLDWQGVHLIHFSGSSCSQKTRIFLNLKGIDWISHPLDLAAPGQLQAVVPRHQPARPGTGARPRRCGAHLREGGGDARAAQGPHRRPAPRAGNPRGLACQSRRSVGPRRRSRVRKINKGPVEGSRNLHHATVVARQSNRLAVGEEVVERGEVQRVEGPHRDGEALQGTGEHGSGQLDECHTSDQAAGEVTVRLHQVSGMQPGPDLVLE